MTYNLIINDMSNNDVPPQDVSNNDVPTNNDVVISNDISGTITTSNIVFTVPYIADMSGNNLNINDVTTLLFNYYTRGT